MFRTRNQRLALALADALGVIDEQGDTIDRLERTVAQQARTDFTLRSELAAVRRQNLALSAQLDHMTRVNQALDTGLLTVPPEEAPHG